MLSRLLIRSFSQVTHSIGSGTQRVVGSGRQSIYASQIGVAKTWPELEGSDKRVPENIFTHLKLDPKPSYNLTHSQGYVVSTKMSKTIAVKVDYKWTHPRVGKVLTKSKKFLAHDEQEVARVGDLVELLISRKLSRHKAWTLHKIIRRENYLTDEPNTPPPEVIPFPKLPYRKPRSKKVAREQKLVIKRRKLAVRRQKQQDKETQLMDSIKQDAMNLVQKANEQSGEKKE